MSERSLYRRIIGGEAGAWAGPLRGLLRVAEVGYAGVIARRNAGFDQTGPERTLPVPVISVGNLTVGGTGKTPFVIELVHRLERMGFSPAVVSRGYNAAPAALNDEQRLIRANCPGIVCVCDPDRALAAEIACQRFGADVVVLDDGFQHRRLGRSLDVVLVDAMCPFGYGHLLPRGLLREPVEALGRAHLVVLNRCDQVSMMDLSQTEARLRAAADQATCIRCTTRVTTVERLDGTAPVESLDGKRVVLFAGIGRPGAFAATVRSMGAIVVGKRWWPDHHRYRNRDIVSLTAPGRFPPHDALVTTEKDAVKLRDLGGFEHAPILVVRIAIDFLDGGGTILQAALDRTLRGSEP